MGHATRMSRVRPRDAAAEEQYDYSGQKRSASFDMGALLSALSSVVGDKDGDPQLLLALRGLLSTSVTRQGLLEAGSKLFDGELFEAIDRGCADDELRVLCKKGFVKVFGKEAPDEEVQREIDSQRSPEPVDEVRVSSIRNVPLYYPNKRKSETKHMLQNKRPERELCGVISTRGVACKQAKEICPYHQKNRSKVYKEQDLGGEPQPDTWSDENHDVDGSGCATVDYSLNHVPQPKFYY